MRKEIEFIEQKELREKVIDRVEVLDRVGELILLPNTEFATTEQVAQYFNVEKKTIEKLSERNIDELLSDGYKTLEKKELSDIKRKNQIKSRARQLAVFPKRAILRVAMLLRDSEVAEEIKRELGLPNNSNIFTRKEIQFKKELDNSIEEIRKELKLHIGALPSTQIYADICKAIENLTIYKSQYSICNNKYRIDFYFPLLNLAVEYDEKYHNSRQEEDKKREYEITREIYINKYLKETTEEDLIEREVKDLYEFYDIEFECKNLTYGFDLTRFVRIKEDDELKSLINLVIIITKMISDELYSRGMNCKYDDLLEFFS